MNETSEGLCDVKEGGGGVERERGEELIRPRIKTVRLYRRRFFNLNSAISPSAQTLVSLNIFRVYVKHMRICDAWFKHFIRGNESLSQLTDNINYEYCIVLSS